MTPSSYVQRILRMRHVSCRLEAPSGRMRDFDGDFGDLVKLLVKPTSLILTKSISPWGTEIPAPSITYAYRVHGLSKRPLTRASLLTGTTKMVCPSFSLPAGPAGKLGGTCLQANNQRLIEEPALYICRSCYATKGNYLYTNMQLAQGVRKRWIQLQLKAGADALAEAFLVALQDYRSKRRVVEVADRRLTIDQSYFRIHDSGDVYWAGDDYYLFWLKMAWLLPDVYFWMPTRDHHVARFHQLVQDAPPPSNLTVRPSALHFQDEPPVVDGFAAGSTSAYNDLADIAIDADFDCPAYAGAKAHTCLNGPGPDGESACRACWTHPHLSINYAPHGTASKAQRKTLGQRAQRVRGNPRGTPSLAALVDDYGGSPVRRNPPEPFEAYLEAHGMYPEDFTEADYARAFPDLDGDEITELMEGGAEWQPLME